MRFFLPSTSREPQQRTRRVTIVTAAILALIVAAAVGGRPVYHRLHSRKLLAEGEAYLAQERYADAIACGRRAVAEQADDVRAARLLLRALGGQGNSDAIKWWLRLSNRPELELADRRELFRWATAWRLIDFADQQWIYLRNEKPFSAETIRIAADYFTLRRDWQKASLFAQAALTENPRDPDCRNVLGRILLLGGSSRDRAIGTRLLFDQARRNDRAGIESLRLLAIAGDLSALDASHCGEWIKSHPLHQIRDTLSEAAFEMTVRPYKRREIATGAASDAIEKGVPAGEVCRWLSRMGLAELAPLTISREQAMRTKDSFTGYLDALGELGRWVEIDALLERPALPLDGLDRALYQARTARERKQSRIEELRWEQALSEAGNDTGKLMRLMEYAANIKVAAPVEIACKRLIEAGGRAAHAGYAELLKLHENDLEKSHSILSSMAKAFPDDRAVLNDLAYAELLLGRNVSRGDELERTVQNAPYAFACRVTLALAQLKNGAAAKARSTLEAAGVPWQEWLPYQQAVYAAACFAAGDATKALEIRKSLDVAPLKVPERELLSGLM